MSNDLKKKLKFLFYKIPSSYILTFHHISAKPENKKSGCILDTDKFIKIIDSYNNYSSINEVVRHPFKRKVAISFDDGLEDVYTIAYPYLKSRNIPFTIFIVADFLDKEGYITKSQLLEMTQDPLVTVGSHGLTHNVLKSMELEKQREELLESQRALEKILQKPVVLFAYSHGQFDKTTLKEVRIYKYAMAVNRLPINFITNKKKYQIPRLNVENSTFDNVLELLSGMKGTKND